MKLIIQLLLVLLIFASCSDAPRLKMVSPNKAWVVLVELKLLNDSLCVHYGEYIMPKNKRYKLLSRGSNYSILYQNPSLATRYNLIKEEYLSDDIGLIVYDTLNSYRISEYYNFSPDYLNNRHIGYTINSTQFYQKDSMLYAIFEIKGKYIRYKNLKKYPNERAVYAIESISKLDSCSRKKMLKDYSKFNGKRLRMANTD